MLRRIFNKNKNIKKKQRNKQTTRKTFIYMWDFLVQLVNDTFVLALFSFEAKRKEKHFDSNNINENHR